MRAANSLRIGLAIAATTMAVGTGTLLATGGLRSGSDDPWPCDTTPRLPVLATVGDIACQPGRPEEGEKPKDVCDKGTGDTTRRLAQTATAEQIETMKPDLVAILGDEQYQVGRYEDFMQSFDTTWGAFKFLHRPAPGNHEFYSEHGETGVHGDGYFDYYNGFQHDASTGAPLSDMFQVDAPGSGTFTQPKPRQDGQAGHVGSDGNGWYSCRPAPRHPRVHRRHGRRGA